jgi:hypothetical protein
MDGLFGTLDRKLIYLYPMTAHSHTYKMKGVFLRRYELFSQNRKKFLQLITEQQVSFLASPLVPVRFTCYYPDRVLSSNFCLFFIVLKYFFRPFPV